MESRFSKVVRRLIMGFFLFWALVFVWVGIDSIGEDSGATVMSFIFAGIAIFITYFFYTWPKRKEKWANKSDKPLKPLSHKTPDRSKPVSQVSEKRSTTTESSEKRLSNLQKRNAEIDFKNAILEIQDAEIVVTDEPTKKQTISHLGDLTYSNITKKTPRDKLGDFVVIDTETTGLKPTSAEIIDIAAIRFRGFKPVSKFSTLLAPQKPIPVEATKINGITNEMVAGKPCFQQIAASLVEFIGKDNIVGHNLPFDLSFIVRYGADVTAEKRKYYDTLAIARRTIKKAGEKWDADLEEYVSDLDSDGIENYKLETLCSWYGIQNSNSHRAEGDALATGQLLKKLADDRV